MGMERVPLDSEVKIQMALNTAKDRYDELLAAGINYLLPGTVTDMNNEHTDYPALRSARNSADSAEHTRVENLEIAFRNLHNRASWYFFETKGHVICGDNPKGVYSNFGMDLDGNHLDMTTPELLIEAGNSIRLGDLIMITDGNVLNTGFTAASVQALFLIFKPIFIDKNAKKGLAGAAETLVVEKGEQVVETLDVIFDAVVANNKGMTEAQLRDELALWGFHYQVAKIKTAIGGHILILAGADGAGAEFRVGPILTTRGKPSKEGVRGTADAHGHFQGETAIEGATFVNVRLLNYADAHVPVTIVPGTNLVTLVIQLVPGISSL
jgi:hypothetical protein